MIRCDVLIVGGGPAGSTLAWALRDSGLSVHILDKRRFPRDKVCAGWITPAVVSALALDLDHYRRERVLQPVRGFRVGCMSGPLVETRYDGGPVSYGIRRCEFDHYLLRRAGAVVHEGVAFKGAEPGAGGIVVNGEYHARLLVGAGGHFCPVARFLGSRLGRSETVVAAQEIEFLMSPEQRAACRVDPELPELYFCDDLGGYGWAVRKGDWLNIGLGREDNHRLAEQVAAFWSHLRARGRITGEPPARFHGHAYLLYPHARRPLGGPRTLLVGDAAGLAYAQSGEGIRPAVESALLAATAIREAGGDFGPALVERYRALLTGRLGPRRQRDAAAWLPAGLRQALGRRLLSSQWFVRHLVMDRWFLHRQQPALAPAG